MTDAFTKYVELVALADKEAETTGEAIFNRWICRHGTPLEIVSDNGKEFRNKLALNCTKDWTSTTPLQRPITHNATPRQKFATKQLQNI